MANGAEPTYTFEGLHHVLMAIPPGAEDSCREFWRDILGMTEMEKPPALVGRGGCWFQKAHPGLLISGLDELAAHLHRYGVEVTWDDNFPGFARFYACDPFGNRLEFLEPVGSEKIVL